MNLKNDKNQYMLRTVNNSAKNCAPVFIEYGESSYLKNLTEAMLSALEKRIILISGPSASGKTTTAKKLAEYFSAIGKKAAVISMDDFYKNRSEMPIIDGKPNPEVIEALELPLLEEVLGNFLEKGRASLPIYDFADGVRRNDAYELDTGKDGYLIMEGLHAINPKIFEHIEKDRCYRIYVSPHSGFVGEKLTLERKELRFLRRLVRDFYKRGSSAENTFEMWQSVCACEDIYIRPLGKTADRMIDTTHAYEICILKETAETVLRTVGKESVFYSEANRLLSFLSEVYPLPISAVPGTSLLNEFLPS